MVGTMQAAGPGAEVCTFPSPGVHLVSVALWVTPGPVPSPRQGPPKSKPGAVREEDGKEGEWEEGEKLRG